MSEKITARITYENKEEAQWFWDIFKTYPNKVNGIKIEGISFGDMFRRCEIYEELYKIFKKLHYNEICNASDEDLEEEELEIKNKIQKLEKEIEETWKRNF